MPAASLSNRGAFLSKVLLDPAFQRDGCLFGQEAGVGRACHWVVLDPNRHAMRVWSKPTKSMDYLAAAQGLGATAFSNGPYWRSNVSLNNVAKYYALGYLREIAVTKHKLDRFGAARLLGLDNLVQLQAAQTTASAFLVDVLVPGSAPRQAEEAASWEKMAIECFGGPPCGVVVQRGATIYTPKGLSMEVAKHGEYVNAYIARGEGSQFTDYSIGSCTAVPTGMEEMMGGVSLAIWDWQDAYLRPGHGSGQGSNQWVYWGLVDLAPAQMDGWLTPAEKDSLSKSIQACQKANAARGPMKGLIVGLFGHADAQTLRNLMLGIGVKEAVSLDTSDSAMFGGGRKILWGDAMRGEKRVAQNFGLAFFPT